MTAQAPSARAAGRPRARLAMLALAALAITASACSIRWIEGSGPIVAETRQVPAFTKLEAGSGVDITIRIGATQSVEVRAYENLLATLLTATDGETLRISSTHELRSGTDPVFVITVPSLDRIRLGGGAEAAIDGLGGGSLGVELGGGARLTAAGTVDTLAIDGGGGVSADLHDLVARTAALELSGGAIVTVHATESVTGDLGPGAEVTVIGDPAVLVESFSGGQIHRG